MRFTLGVDEAGRGPLAGPVAVGVVLVPEGFDVVKAFPGVADSKKLSEKNREKIYEMLVVRNMLGDTRFAVEFEDALTIDREGIVPAVRRALTRGVNMLAPLETGRLKTAGALPGASLTGRAPDISNVFIYLDGSLRAPSEYAQETIIHGDALIPLISLASIAAKVERDRLMLALAKEYPQYGFEEHKGYGTKMHYDRLLEYGPCAIHRRSFLHLDSV